MIWLQRQDYCRQKIFFSTESDELWEKPLRAMWAAELPVAGVDNAGEIRIGFNHVIKSHS